MPAYPNSKVLLNRYNGRLTSNGNNLQNVLSQDNGTRFEAQVVINGGDRAAPSKLKTFAQGKAVNNSVVIQSPI